MLIVDSIQEHCCTFFQMSNSGRRHKPGEQQPVHGSALECSNPPPQQRPCTAKTERSCWKRGCLTHTHTRRRPSRLPQSFLLSRRKLKGHSDNHLCDIGPQSRLSRFCQNKLFQFIDFNFFLSVNISQKQPLIFLKMTLAVSSGATYLTCSPVVIS